MSSRTSIPFSSTGQALIAALALAVVACQASASASMSGGKTEASASASGNENSSSFSENTTTSAPPPANSGGTSAPPAPRPGCQLVCTNAHSRVRLAPADEQKLTSALASELDTLQKCTPQGQPPGLTLRFDSTGTLTHFGVDDERHSADGMCVDGVRSHKPTLSFPGPSTVRCGERCGRVR